MTFCRKDAEARTLCQFDIIHKSNFNFEYFIFFSDPLSSNIENYDSILTTYLPGLQKKKKKGKNTKSRK